MLSDFIIQNGKGYTLPYPAERWEEGTLLGNGSQGAIIMGNVQREEIILSHERLFAPINLDLEPIPMADHLPTIRTMLKERKYKEASEYVVEMFQKQENRETKYWTNPFIPAADFIIETSGCYSYTNYERSLKFKSGEGKISFKTKDGGCERKSFFSRDFDCMVIELSSEASTDYRMTFTQHPYRKEGRKILHENFPEADGESFFLPKLGTKNKSVWYTSGYRNRENGYGVLCYIADCDGKIINSKEEIVVLGSHRVLLLLQVFLIDDMTKQEEIISKRQEELDNYSIKKENSYENMIKDHLKIHKNRYEKMELELPEEKHLETIFNAGRYEILSSCGEIPPNLQGVWTGTYEGGWSSDYTQNGNLQTAILGLLPSGDFESMMSYFDYNTSMLAKYRRNSQILYGCRGIHVPSRASDSGLDFHFDLTWPMIFWTAGGAWAAHFYYDYWLYTGDDTFFLDRALPFMKEVALFYEDFLQEDENGYWLFSPSYSPENTPLNSDNAASINATMDISVAKELFMNLIVGCNTLGIEKKEIEKWKKIVDKMPPYLINEDGALKEWARDDLEDRYDHRHSSHLYMLYYDIPWYEEERVLQACKKAYEIKMKFKKEEHGIMAFGLVQAGMVAAHLGDEEMTEIMIRSMADNNYFRTYASAHDYGPTTFNADISGGMPALMLETIAQSSPIVNREMKIEGYKIKLLPALPKSMKSGRIRGLHLRGGFILNMTWKDGKVEEWNIKNPLDNEYYIVKDHPAKRIYPL